MKFIKHLRVLAIFICKTINLIYYFLISLLLDCFLSSLFILLLHQYILFPTNNRKYLNKKTQFYYSFLFPRVHQMPSNKCTKCISYLTAPSSSSSSKAALLPWYGVCVFAFFNKHKTRRWCSCLIRILNWSASRTVPLYLYIQIFIQQIGSRVKFTSKNVYGLFAIKCKCFIRKARRRMEKNVILLIAISRYIYFQTFQLLLQYKVIFSIILYWAMFKYLPFFSVVRIVGETVLSMKDKRWLRHFWTHPR